MNVYLYVCIRFDTAEVSTFDISVAFLSDDVEFLSRLVRLIEFGHGRNATYDLDF